MRHNLSQCKITSKVTVELLLLNRHDFRQLSENKIIYIQIVIKTIVDLLSCQVNNQTTMNCRFYGQLSESGYFASTICEKYSRCVKIWLITLLLDSVTGNLLLELTA